MLQSELGDPRVPPESEGWVRLKKFDPRAYDQFLTELTSTDIHVFFTHTMKDKQRKDFWERYLRSIRRTVCVLDRTALARLTTQLATADKKLRSAVTRARKFASKGSDDSAQAFCLYFDTHVIVEFSATGNAAHIYERRVFEKHFEAAIFADKVSGPNQPKNQPLAFDRVIHNEGWEAKTHAVLRGLGIHPDRRA